jgi:BASS family bile acid:Na+ symporter
MNLITDIALPISLGMVMLSMGLSLTVADFARVFAEPRPIIVGLFSLLVVVPLLGLLVASNAPVSNGLALGIFLIATCPGGTFSNLLTSFGKGDVALSISMTAIGCLVYVFLAPIWTDLGMERLIGNAAHASLPRVKTFIELVEILVLPTAIGVFARAKLPTAVHERLTSLVKSVAVPAVLGIFVYIFVETHDSLDWNVLPAVLALNLATVFTGWIASRIARMTDRQTVAVVSEHAVRQEGTAIYLATSALMVPEAALPLMLNAFVGFGVGCLFIAIQRSRARRVGQSARQGT